MREGTATALLKVFVILIVCLMIMYDDADIL